MTVEIEEALKLIDSHYVIYASITVAIFANIALVVLPTITTLAAVLPIKARILVNKWEFDGNKIITNAQIKHFEDNIDPKAFIGILESSNISEMLTSADLKRINDWLPDLEELKGKEDAEAEEQMRTKNKRPPESGAAR